MKYIVIFMLLVFGCAAHVPTKYFPVGAFSADRELDSFVQSRYGKYLSAMKEPSLVESAQAQYRFLWLPTFNPPMVFRISIQNGKYVFYSKRTAGTGGSYSGRLVDDLVFEIPADLAAKVINKLEQDCQFWALPTKIDKTGLDGSQWVFEATNNGKFHVVDRWSPGAGCLYEVGVELMSLSRLMIFEIY